MYKSQPIKYPICSDFETNPPVPYPPLLAIETENSSDMSEKLLKTGELRLLHGDIFGLYYFDMALKLDPSNPQLYLTQALALFEYGSAEKNKEALKLASKRFKVTTRMNPKSFDAWHAWGNTLYLLGQKNNEKHFFYNAKNKYQKAIALIDKQAPGIIADLYSDYGDLWMKLAEFSGEAIDYHIALKSYETATTYLEDLPTEFWKNFGHVYIQLGSLANDLRFFIKAIHCYKEAISISISSYESWFDLGKVLKIIYSYTHDEDHFLQASECYATAVNLNPKESSLWIDWAILLNDSGKISKDTKYLRSAIEKCHKAYACTPQNPLVKAIWAEALARLGLQTERLDLIHEAQNKIIEATQSNAELPEIWYSYGVTLTALATYFNDLDYYYQAIEKFQVGISINRACHKIWFALGKTSYITAQIENEPKIFERTCRFFQRAISLHISSEYHYNYALTLSRLGELNQNEKIITLAIYHFEKAINLQKNAEYQHPDWLFHYGCTLDLYSEFSDNEANYIKAIEILNHVLIFEPEFPEIHYRIALVYAHYGELVHELGLFHRALQHYRFAHQRDKENSQIILDWAITLINLADLFPDTNKSDQYFREAEYKIIQSAKLGNVHTYFHLSCLYSLRGQNEKALQFLNKAHAFEALPSREELLEDDWLENLRSTEGFQNLIEHIECQSNSQDS